jgi:hypothetical protein
LGVVECAAAPSARRPDGVIPGHFRKNPFKSMVVTLPETVCDLIQKICGLIIVLDMFETSFNVGGAEKQSEAGHGNRMQAVRRARRWGKR